MFWSSVVRKPRNGSHTIAGKRPLAKKMLPLQEMQNDWQGMSRMLTNSLIYWTEWSDIDPGGCPSDKLNGEEVYHCPILLVACERDLLLNQLDHPVGFP